jgi:alpha-tubulin suppressor-like RCC1 family protein
MTSMSAWVTAVQRRRVLPAVLISLIAGLSVLIPPPQAVLAASQSTASISAGAWHSCAIESGKAYCWGENAEGELGDGNTTNSDTPVAVDTSGALAGKTLTQISAGDYQTCALDSTGAAYCWGDNPQGELGDGNTINSDVPVAVDTSGALAGKTLTQISASFPSTCALDTTGAAYCWGDNEYGELGDGTHAYDSTVPVPVETSGVLAGKALTQIADGEIHTCALDTAGAAYCWGGYTAVGNGGTVVSFAPVAMGTSGVLAGKTLTRISAGGLDTCALDSSGAAYCWGVNNSGELGDNSTTDSTVPVAVDTSGALAGKTLIEIIAGQSNTCALDSTGAAYCWGDNQFGELGTNGATNSSIPVPVETSGVLAGMTLTEIAVGDAHSCALGSTGATYCWGDNSYGELGDDSTNMSEVPVLAGPQAPTGLTAIPGDTIATVSWTAPTSLDGGTVIGYTASAAPGGAACTTASGTTCTLTGLANGTTYSITVVAHTTCGNSGASTPVTVTPAGGPAFTSGSAATAAFGHAFRFTVTAVGDPAPRITRTGRLPSGVRFADKSDGTATISGTPDHAAAGVYPLTLIAKNETGTATQAFTLTVTRAPGIRRIRLIRARVGVALRLTIRTSGYPQPSLAESAPLPSGLSFTDNRNGTAVIAGTPGADSAGHYPITITATNTSGTATRQFAIAVTPGRTG